MAKRLFGTDGIRGVAGEPPLDPKTVLCAGIALGNDLRAHYREPKVLIGMDTRESSPWIAEHLAGGLESCGVRATFAGVITTPGVAYLTRSAPFEAGVMISASHNPYRDNGIKVFAATGFKLPDPEEQLIEQEIFRLLESGFHAAPVRLPVDGSLHSKYLDFLISTLSTPLEGMRVVLDCGNGAASSLAPALFERAGAKVTAICNRPDGRNINLDCGALHVEKLQQAILAGGADAGAAFDGDADRTIMVSGSGKVIDGDAMMLIAGRSLQSEGRLSGDTVVATVMSNLGLEQAFTRARIDMLRTPVGDKYVLEKMVEIGAALGGEQSGHVIFRQYATTGDGMLTALHILEIAKRRNLSLESLTEDLDIYPQRLVNVQVKRRKALADLPVVQREIQSCEQALNGAGRVLVRFSGTEPLARVMVEGPTMAQVEDYSKRIADAIRGELG